MKEFLFMLQITGYTLAFISFAAGLIITEFFDDDIPLKKIKKYRRILYGIAGVAVVILTFVFFS